MMLEPRGARLQSIGGTGRAVTLKLGVLSDTKEALPETLAQLDQLAALFRREEVTAIVVLGGIDPTFEGIRLVLTHLQVAGPIIALPGDRESLSGWQAAMEALGRGGVDLTRITSLSLAGMGIVGVPGYFLHHHLLAQEQGCSYNADDIDEVIDRVQGLPPMRVLFSHGPPRGERETAVDLAFGGVHIGDPQLHRLMQEGHVAFGIFGHVHEAVGHATTLSGQVVSPMVWSDSLLLNVGSAEAIPHEDLAGQWWQGTAAMVELTEKKARYRMLAFKREKNNPGSWVSFDRSRAVR
jgi:hypothetical protein